MHTSKTITISLFKHVFRPFLKPSWVYRRHGEKYTKVIVTSQKQIQKRVIADARHHPSITLACTHTFIQQETRVYYIHSMSLGIKRGYQDVSKGDLTGVPHRVSFDEHDQKSNDDDNAAKTYHPKSIDTKDSLENPTLLLEEALWGLPHSNKKKRSTMYALVLHDLPYHASASRAHDMMTIMRSRDYS